jgi:dTDP-4-amino-4,6-dideoxygalactose transaminase
MATLKSRTIKPIKFLNLPLHQRALRKPLLAAMTRVLDGAHFILGPEVQALEKEVAAGCGAKFGVGVNSGTDALVLALRALNIGPGDEVLVPDFTFIATATSVLLVGATPVLVDVEPGTLTLDPKLAAKAVTRRTKAIIPVHLYGQPADMTAILALAKKHKLAVVEDACQSLGATWRGRQTGSLGDAGAISFFPTKNLGGIGDGGMLVTNRAEVAAHVKRLRNHGCDQKYIHLELGYNSRLAEIQAAALRVKLPHLEKWNRRRQYLAGLYAQGLSGTSVITPSVCKDAAHVFHQYAVLTPHRDALRKFLQVQGIETAIHYPMPLHTQPLLKGLASSKAAFPVSKRAAREVLCLPITPELTNAEAARVVEAIQAFFHKSKYSI